MLGVLQGTNTLAYYEHSKITDVKIYNIGPGVKTQGREVLLRGKAQYSWPPCPR